MHFGRIVKEARGSMSLRQFGSLVGVNKATVDRMEQAVHTPSTRTLAKLAPHTKYSLEELVAIIDGRSEADRRDVIISDDIIKHCSELTNAEKRRLIETLVKGMSPSERKSLMTQLIYLM